MSRTPLWCVVLGESEPFHVDPDIAKPLTTSEFKEVIHEKKKNGAFKGIDAADLIIWKLTPPIPTDKLTESLLTVEGLKDLAKRLNPVDGVRDISPVEKHLVIVVQRPESVQPPRKRFRSDRDESHRVLSLFTDLHHQYWGHPLDSALTTLPTSATDLGGLELDDEEDDVLLGNPFMDTLNTRFLVRAEYIRTFDSVKALYDEDRRDRLAVVTGQPGIGKTQWISYALCRCLGVKQPVIYYLAQACYFFSDTGVEITLPEQSGYPEYTWCLVDSTAADRLPDLIYNPYFKLFPVYVTSPKEERWAKLHQLRLPSLIIMNPWTRAELERAKVLYPERTTEDISERFDNAGPTPRLCLQYTSSDMSRFYRNREAMIKWGTPQRMVAVLMDEKEERLRIDQISHQICVVRRSASDASQYTVEPISVFVRQRLLAQIWEWEEKDRIALIKRFEGIPDAGGMTGVLFESQYQRQFAEKIDIVAKPMFQTSNPRSRWHANFGDFSASPMLQKTQEVLSTVPPPSLTLSISPSETRVYEHSGPITIEENVYYVPSSKNEVAIDSFIVHAGHLYLFQFASGQQHSVNRGLLATLSRFSNLPVSENLHFIFVVPKRLARFNCPHSDNGFLHDHVPYVAQIDVEL